MNDGEKREEVEADGAGEAGMSGSKNKEQEWEKEVSRSLPGGKECEK